MEKSGISNATIVALIVGLVLGFAGGAYWYKGKMAKIATTRNVVTDDKTKPATTTVTTKPVSTTDEDKAPISIVVDTNIISAANQSAGATVTVSKVSSNTEIWVAVREDNGGLMSNVLGAKKVSAGVTENVVIQLLRATKANSKYYIVLYKDNGDGAFDSKKDTIIESDGRVVVSTFRTL